MEVSDESVCVLDVGHGLACLISSSGTHAAIDTARAPALLKFLRQKEIASLKYVLISHLDFDHMGGLENLVLNGIDIEAVYFNTDATIETDAFDRLRRLIADGKIKRGVVQTALTSHTNGGFFRFGNVELEIIYPAPEDTMVGPGSMGLDGQEINTNSMSAVVLLRHLDVPVMLFPGDIEELSLKKILTDGSDLSAKILIFPHHGGQVNGDIKSFCEDILRAVNPNSVIFSIGRGKHGTPDPRVVESIRDYSNAVYIGCTQLSGNCRADIDGIDMSHLLPLPSAGVSGKRQNCCAGTFNITLNGDATSVDNQTSHLAFLTDYVPDRLCKTRQIIKE